VESVTTSDPFDKFYTSLQEMLSRLSHPLAFATAPLDGTAPEYGGESFFFVGDEYEGGRGMGDTMVPITRSMAGTMLQGLPPPLPLPEGVMRVQEVVREGASEGRGGKTLEEYAVENHQLKIAVDQLSRKVASYKEVTNPLVITLL
jgi:hypothetical protein